MSLFWAYSVIAMAAMTQIPIRIDVLRINTLLLNLCELSEKNLCCEPPVTIKQSWRNGQFDVPPLIASLIWDGGTIRPEFFLRPKLAAKSGAWQRAELTVFWDGGKIRRVRRLSS